MKDEKRPSRISMEGMIWSANHVLDHALSPNVNGIPRTFFEASVGLVLVSVVEAGFMFSGTVGTGIILKKQGRGTWSPPSACGLTGVGWGLLIGASVKDFMIFIMEDEAMDAIAKNSGLKLGTQSEITLGPLGRAFQFDINASKGGIGSTVCIAFSKGVFAGLSIAGSVLGVRPVVNKSFYGRDITITEILKSSHDLIPRDKVTMIDEIYEKLRNMEEGMIERVVLEHEIAKRKAAAEQAEKSAEHVKAQEDVVEVNAAELAAKENA